MLLRCMKITSSAEKTHIESIGASAFASHAAIGSEAAAQIEPSDTLCVERLTDIFPQIGVGGVSAVLTAAGSKGEHHHQSQCQRYYLFHT